ncbi:MAG TPA: GNAT family protein [Rhodocyclaceae bacterium]|nr:GNAT family protein [Rhodocyclaceae bacterium]
MTARIYLRHPALTDQREFLASVRASHALHHPWTSPPSTPKQFHAYIERMRETTSCGSLICERNSKAIAGVINITNIVHGAFRSGYLGYYAFCGFEHQGLMREGLQAVVRHAFKTLKLHRLEANIQPGNTASIALVKSCGFSREGFSPRYLKIGGRWCDHERWAILAS